MPRVSLLGVSLLFASASALAEPSPGPNAGIDPASVPALNVVDDREPKPPLIPRVNDVLGGHVLVGAAVGAAWSLGDLSSSVGATRGLGAGIGFKADLGLGLSRALSLGAWGELARYGDGRRCSDCAGSAFGVGPFIRYHLSQGLRFDPWLLAGAGYRTVSFDDASGTQKYSGIQWLRLELGADYYAWSGAALGPYTSLSLTSYGSRPAADPGSTSVNTELSAGLRLLFDFPGR